jgi:ATP-binding cassette subfamily B protein
LRGIDLDIPLASRTAIVGLNGAGKSTLIKLLCRLYEPTRGRITWDGVDIRELDAASLRARISSVFQDFMTYEMTAAENIELGDVSREQTMPTLAAAAASAGIDDDLAALPDGYDTMLSRVFSSEGTAPGSRRMGALLSGGQWQRVALARALLRSDVDLLILDEPTSGLDAEAEATIHATLRDHGPAAARLLISHRLNTVRDADRIIVLRQGEIVEVGTHAELMDAHGGYATLFRLQAAGYADATAPGTAIPALT